MEGCITMEYIFKKFIFMKQLMISYDEAKHNEIDFYI